ncbi:hypothetical protein [Streptomyces sp. KL116D]|uniref:hypothetical protein n=1 Tax=Streptomyces sp. KL116D TaxID=3045152 RepID=UPI0035573D76
MTISSSSSLTVHAIVQRCPTALRWTPREHLGPLCPAAVDEPGDGLVPLVEPCRDGAVRQPHVVPAKTLGQVVTWFSPGM